MGTPTTPRHHDSWSELVEVAGYADGVPRNIDIPQQTVDEMFEETASRFGSRLALDFFGATTSYRELQTQINAAATTLQQRGVRPGDRVAIALPSCPQAVIAFYAVLRVGAVVVEHNLLSTRSEFERCFRDHEARVAIVWNKVAQTIADIDSPASLDILTVDMSRALPRLKRLALSLPLPQARTARAAITEPANLGVSFDDVVSSCARQQPTHASFPRRDPDDLALLQYTGGTTGDPKAAMLTHRNLVANVVQSMAWVPTLRAGEEVFYGTLPLFHAYGMTLCLLDAIRLGACLVLFPRFDEAAVCAAMKRRPATFIPGVPPIYERLLKLSQAGRIDLAGVRWAISGAMPLDPGLVDRWESATGGMLIEGYGMTETSPIALANPLSQDRRPGSIGIPFPSTAVRIADLDDPQSPAAPGVAGELQIQGPQVCVGYWGKPDLTDALFTTDGWLRTGDVAVQDDDDFVTIVDRLKEVIITAGFNVYPSEVEDVLRAFDGVRDVAVVGRRLAGGDEAVTAAIVLDDASSLDEEALTRHARRHLAGYKIPREYVIVPDIPLSPLGKVMRRSVRDALPPTA